MHEQEGKRGRDNRDATGQPLFSYVDEAIWQRPTYRLFQALLDNYHRCWIEPQTPASESATSLCNTSNARLQCICGLCHV